MECNLWWKTAPWLKRSFDGTFDEDNLWSKSTFDGRWPFMGDNLLMEVNLWWKKRLMDDNLWWKTPLIEDDLWWKITCDGRQSLMKDDLWGKAPFQWKINLEGRRPVMVDNLQCKKSFYRRLWFCNKTINPRCISLHNWLRWKWLQNASLVSKMPLDNYIYFVGQIF